MWLCVNPNPSCGYTQHWGTTAFPGGTHVTELKVLEHQDIRPQCGRQGPRSSVPILRVGFVLRNTPFMKTRLLLLALRTVRWSTYSCRGGGGGNTAPPVHAAALTPQAEGTDWHRLHPVRPSAPFP